jgi:hypothetical protein
MNRIAKIQFSMLMCLFIIILFSVLCLPSCNKLKEGDVVAKWYEPKTTRISLMPMITSSGSTIMIPYLMTDNEDYVVKIKAIYKDEERIETIYVSQKQYECLSVGSHFKLTEDCSTSDDNNQKERQNP